MGREGVDVRAGGGARFVGAVRTVAGVVVDLAKGESDGRVRDAGELVFLVV